MVDLSPDGLDTALARILHQRELVDLPTLRACLIEVRAERGPDSDLGLASLLLERRLVAPEGLDQAVEELAASQTAASGARAAAGSPLPSVGPYTLVRELARGGMGVVYEGVHKDTGVRYAVKRLLSDDDADSRLRFRQEAELLARLDHPNVVRVHSAEFVGKTAYLIQDLLPGGSLQERLARQGPLDPSDAIDVVLQLTRGLAHAHERGVLHRDLKPQNVLFGEGGEPRLVDFGLGLQLGAVSRRLTATGVLIGTPSYMAPEQAHGRADADVRADVYGMGGILYATLTGRPPFSGAGLFAILDQVLNATPSAPSALNPKVPPALDALCLRALAKRPDDRYADADALALALEACRQGAPPSRSWTRFLPLVTVPLLAVGVLAVVSGTGGAPVGGRPSGADLTAGGSRSPEEPTEVGSTPTAPQPDSRRTSEIEVPRPGAEPTVTVGLPTLSEVVERPIREEFPSATETFRIYLKSALSDAKGRANSMRLIGDALNGQREMLLVDRDPLEGLRWHWRASEEGDALAKARLGKALRDGEVVARDPEGSAVWFRGAAEGGNLWGMVHLGEALLRGDGVPKDVAAAELWFRRAADPERVRRAGSPERRPRGRRSGSLQSRAGAEASLSSSVRWAYAACRPMLMRLPIHAV